MTEEELKELMEIRDLKRQVDAAKANPPAPAAVAERTPPQPNPAPVAPQPAPVETRDPNAERWQGTGAQIMARVQPNEAMEETRWVEAEERFGRSIRHARVFRAVAVARLDGLEDGQRAICRVLSDTFEDLGTARMVEGLYTREASSQRPVDGGFLVPMETSSRVIEFLEPYTVMGSLGLTFLTVPSGSLSMNEETTGCTAKYGFENAAVHNSDTPKLGQVNWNTKRLDCEIVFPKELIRRASFDADALFRRRMGSGFAQKMEHTFVNGAGQNGEIVGLENHKRLTDVVITDKIDEKNIYKFKQALRKNNVPMLDSVKYLFNEDHEYALSTYENTNSGIHPFQQGLDNGTLKGRPFLISQNIETRSTTGKPSTIYVGDWSEYYVIREGGIEMDSTDKGAYEDASGNVKSAFSRHQVAIKMIDWHDMGPADGRKILRCKGAKTE